jgi:hypothetical protein
MNSVLFVGAIGIEGTKEAEISLDLTSTQHVSGTERADTLESVSENGGFGPAFGPTPALASTSPLTASARLTLDVARAKLDAAILAEAWDAVKVIAERVRQLERVDVVDFALERAKRTPKA